VYFTVNKHLTPFQPKSMFHLSFHRLMVSFDMVTQGVYLWLTQGANIKFVYFSLIYLTKNLVGSVENMHDLNMFMSLNSYIDIFHQVYWYGDRQDLVMLYISDNSCENLIISVKGGPYYKGVI